MVSTYVEWLFFVTFDTCYVASTCRARLVGSNTFLVSFYTVGWENGTRKSIDLRVSSDIYAQTSALHAVVYVQPMKTPSRQNIPSE